MTGLRTLLIVLTLAGWGICCGSLTADDEPPLQLKFPSSQAAVFGDTEQSWMVSLTGPVPEDALLSWEYSANDRTLSRGEVPIERSDDEPQARIALRTPPVKQGITFQSTLTATLSQQGKILAQQQMPVWIFAEDPFYQHQEWLKELELKIFDPEGETIKQLDRAKIPFQEISSGQLEDLQAGLLIIGEGISLKKHRSLGVKLLLAASKGKKILWLAPGDGNIPFPGADREGFTGPTTLIIRQQDIVTTLDKRLDSNAWTSSETGRHRFQIIEHNGRVKLESKAESRGWDWVDARFQNGGRLVLCSFPLISTWDEGPTSRYLFTRILESLEQDPPVN